VELRSTFTSNSSSTGAFFSYLAKEVFPTWAALCASDLFPEVVKLRHNWETLKRSFSGKEEEPNLHLEIPKKLRNHARPGTLQDTLLVISKALMQQFFRNVLARIEARIEQQLEAKEEKPAHRLKKVVLFLCGGFSESVYLR
jgi:hypothetical protein